MEFILISPFILNSPEECGICYDTHGTWTKLPCSHKLCSDCFHNLRTNSCPWCRAFIPSSIAELAQSLTPSPRINNIEPTTRRPRSYSDPINNRIRSELRTPEEVINYEREISRKAEYRARKLENKKRNNNIRKDFYKNNRDVLSRIRDPVTEIRNKTRCRDTKF